MTHATETERLFQQVLNETPEEIKTKVDWSFDIANKIDLVLHRKGISQKAFASMTGTSEAAVSKWLGGNHNFTLSTLAKISAALGEPIITVAD
jgi:DNA-binding Xre family transcriptional regulator